MGRGVAGIQGALYGGTGCFHRRKVMYGLSPDDIEIDRRDSLSNGEANGNKLVSCTSQILLLKQIS